MQGKRRRGGQKQEGGEKKELNAGTTSGTSACLHSRVAHIHTLLPPPTSPCNLQPKSQRERFSMCTAKQHLISQLISTEVTATVSLSNSEDGSVLMLTLSSVLTLSRSPSPHPITALYFLYSSLPVSIPPLPVLHHYAQTLSFHIASETS